MGSLSHFCGFNLKMGTILIGIVQSIFAFIIMILSAAYAEYPKELKDMVDPTVLPLGTSLRYLLISVSILSAVQCLFSILLIFGAETNRPVLLVPWLIFNPIAVGIYVFLTLIAIVRHSTGDHNAIFIAGHLITASILSLVATYKIIAVHSFYKHLRSLNF